MNSLQIFGDRLKNIGIDIEMAGNYPWIYLSKVNGNSVKDKFRSDHGFVVAMLRLDGGVDFTDLKEIFRTIRKYK